MKDNRIKKLADVILDHSVKIKSGENLYIELVDAGEDLAVELIRGAYARNAHPHLEIVRKRLLREIICGMDDGQADLYASYDIVRMQNMDACVAIRGTENDAEFSGIDPAALERYQSRYNRPINTELRLTKKWNVLRYITPAMASAFGMNSDDFETYFFQVCCLDYAKFGTYMERLAERMERADKVHIVATGTDLTFSIKGMHAVVSDGINNLPDGEVSCGPIRDSANGHITYNAGSDYLGFIHKGVRFELKDGKIISADSNDSVRTNAVLDIDQGARYIGEFALGLNPYITRPVVNTLFDEKAAGSIHFTPGNAYANSFNGNRSSVHWDLVQMHTPEYGGGEIWFDDELIRKDGLFVSSYLQCLNPQELIKNV